MGFWVVFFVWNKLHTLRDMIGRDMIGPSTLSIPRVYRGMNTGEGLKLVLFIPLWGDGIDVPSPLSGLSRIYPSILN